MLREQLSDHNVILASGSPRRQHFFSALDIPCTIDVREVEEVYPAHLKGAEITDYLAKKKASMFDDLQDNDIVVTSDTIVWKDDKAIEKPGSYEEAFGMLRELSGAMHEVMTSVCFTTKSEQIVLNDTTRVWFRELSDEEINYYIENHKPFDKAGSYGIQDWLGYIGIDRLEGCYFNVMGLPTRLVYKTLMGLASH